VVVFSLAQNKLVTELSCVDQDLLCIQFSPDGSQMAVGGRDGHLRIWDTTSNEMVIEAPLHKGRLESLVYRKDGEIISTVGRDRTLSRFDAVSGEKLAQHQLVCGKMTALMQLDSLLTAVGTADNSIRLFCWIEQNEIRKLTGHQGSVSVLARNQNTLYSGSFDTTIRAWDIEEIVLAMTKPDDERIVR
jgi:WD40 repeat protein